MKRSSKKSAFSVNDAYLSADNQPSRRDTEQKAHNCKKCGNKRLDDPAEETGGDIGGLKKKHDAAGDAEEAELVLLESTLTSARTCSRVCCSVIFPFLQFDFWCVLCRSRRQVRGLYFYHNPHGPYPRPPHHQLAAFVRDAVQKVTERRARAMWAHH